ncbi:hypothetical protein [Kosmotoga pacifica]|uniref:PAS domain-containing protein n=1 Tax=Kosmotoga pacifica TaxID=1330330 RepID=A0A0G2Z9I5_9BACT|nr:hypothetical protein [Kosmotoga pacifica]AKI96746.1 hypothetical protein IX53_01695 [Kosmotoga pacifica]
MAATRTIWEILWDYDPNALVVLDKELRIKIINPAFIKLFNIGNAESILGQKIEDFFLDTSLFERVKEKNEIIRNHRVYFAKYGVTASVVIFPILEVDMIAAIIIDITSEIEKEEKHRKIRLKAAEQVQEVVENQMKVAQEIASILGETVAETKAQLIKLKEIISQE